MNETHSNKFHRTINLEKNNTISITSYPNENEAEHSLFIINLDSSDINVEFIPVGAYTHPDFKVEFDDITSVTIEPNNNESEEQNRIVQLNSSEMNNGSNDNIHQGLIKVEHDKTNFISIDLNEIKLEKQTNSLKHDRFNFGDKLYKCKICLKSFFDSTTLARHEIAHYGDVGDSLYKCDICYKAFFDSSDLAQHIRFHYTN